MNIEKCKNFSEVLYYHSSVNPKKVCIYDIRSERSYTFEEFNAIVEMASNYLISKNIKPGDRVTAVIENSPEYCFFYFATLRIGAIYNPMPFTSHREEIKKNILYAEPSAILVDNKRFNEFDGEDIRYIDVPVGKERTLEKRLNDYKGKVAIHWEIDENKPACLYYSSGTTGNQKGVLFSHKNMISNISSICRGFQFSSENEVHLILLPLGHTAAINYSLLPCMYVGGNIIIAESFWHIRNRIYQLIQAHKVTYLEVVPTVLYSILNIHKDTLGQDVSTIRFVGCGSAPLQKSIQKEFFDRYKLKVANLYGLSETGPTHIDYPLKDNWQSSSIGVPLDVNEVKIFNKSGDDIGSNQIGEIVVKGDNVFIGYFKNDMLYKSVVKNGYFHTGDLGYKDEEGCYYFVDREKDLIIKGGINITSGEIDEVLLMHPAIKEAATIGMPDDMFGEEIKSFVVLKDGFSVSVQEILDHCKGNLSLIKIPKEVDIVDDIPKTHSGKLLKKELRKRQEAGKGVNR